jgi:hypothetical protein
MMLSTVFFSSRRYNFGAGSTRRKVVCWKDKGLIKCLKDHNILCKMSYICDCFLDFIWSLLLHFINATKILLPERDFSCYLVITTYQNCLLINPSLVCHIWSITCCIPSSKGLSQTASFSYTYMFYCII